MIANVADAMVVIGERTRERDEARAENERAHGTIAALRETVERLAGDNERLRKALDAYADRENWGRYHTKFVSLTYWRQDIDDPGGLARDALKDE